MGTSDGSADTSQTPAAIDTAITPDQLRPISGVDLAAFAQITAGLAAYNFDTTKAVEIAADRGVDAGDWTAAADGWNVRITASRAVAREFNRLYTQG